MKKLIAMSLAFLLLGCNEKTETTDTIEAEVIETPVVAVEIEPEPEKPVDNNPVFTTEGYEQKEIPPRAHEYLPNLYSTAKSLDFPPRYLQSIAGQIEQETCYSYTHRFCWNPKVEVKNHREYGFGLGQITIAYREDGSERFNVFKELKQQPEFKDWKWHERFDPDYQIMGILVKLRGIYSALKFDTENDYEKFAFMFAAYNGGLGGVLSDRRICLRTEGCDTTRWFNGVEATSNKSKRSMEIYGGKSIFEINREYPRRILEVRMHKYLWYLEGLGEYP